MVNTERLRKPKKPKEIPQQTDISEALEISQPTETTPQIILSRTSPIPSPSEVTVSGGAPCFTDEVRQHLVDEITVLINRNWRAVQKGEEAAKKLVFYAKAQQLIAKLKCPQQVIQNA